MVTLKESIRNEAFKTMARILRVETCEVLDVQLHQAPEDKKMNTVTIKLRDSENPTQCTEIIRYRIPVLLSHIGHLFGFTWNPRVGDLVKVLFLANEKAYVISPFWNQEEKPICRQHVDDIVFKFCQTPPAEYDTIKCRNGNSIKHLKRFLNPEHPVCQKFFGKDRGFIFVSDCPLGHSHPDCEICTDLEDIENHSNSIKWYPSQHPKHPNRVRYSHKKGQKVQLEDDGSILIEDSRGNYICLLGEGTNEQQGIVIKDKSGSFIALNGEGNITVHATQNGSHNLHNVACECGGGNCTMLNRNPSGYHDLDKTPKQQED